MNCRSTLRSKIGLSAIGFPPGGPVTGAKPMPYLRRFLQLPANESSLGLVLSLSVVTLGLMSIALVWQAEIIANQREVIR